MRLKKNKTTALELVKSPAANVHIRGVIDFARVITLKAKNKKVLKFVINLLREHTRISKNINKYENNEHIEQISFSAKNFITK